MTFDNAAWAINGATLGSSLARRAQFAAVEGFEGIIQDADLKVTQLGVPGVGVQIAPGAAIVLNRYQTTPNEAYTVSNPSVHTITSGEMPAANPAAKSYLVAVVIGDPDFSQAGHPWMGSSDPAAGTEDTFLYVRPTIIAVAAGATTPPAGYPALALARIDVPANTTTITDAMITDLRGSVRPKPERFAGNATGGTVNSGATVNITAACVVPARPYRRVVQVAFGGLCTSVSAGYLDFALKRDGTAVRTARTNSPNVSGSGSMSITLEAGETTTFQLAGAASGGNSVVTADGRFTYLEANAFPA